MSCYWCVDFSAGKNESLSWKVRHTGDLAQLHSFKTPQGTTVWKVKKIMLSVRVDRTNFGFKKKSFTRIDAFTLVVGVSREALGA